MKLSKDFYQKHRDKLDSQDRIADKVTSFAGSMPFIYVHALWFALWIGFKVEKFPYGLLTMVVSLEAIFLSTLVMISQNRQEDRDKVQAEHQFEHQELELAENTDLTKEIHQLTRELHRHIMKQKVKK